ncbi:MAG: formylglycine-generating enzyme family protein [Thermoguttaceae bacterium]|jgi:formylglycine-generating enzyme required for sulfatase activity
MFRQASTIALLVIMALGSVVFATASGSKEKEAGDKINILPKELTFELGRGIKLEIVLVPAGEFMMGSSDSDEDASSREMPQHKVRIKKPFHLGRYLVTQEQWEAVIGSNPSHFKGSKNPVDLVSWEDCQKFLEELNAKIGTQSGEFTLPTEAAWEYACRAGSTTQYCFDDDDPKLSEYAWYNANSGNTTHPVGEKKPNAWGLYDMHGNVWEWCQDWYASEYYSKSLVDDPTGPATGSDRVIRGGCWLGPSRGCRSAVRTNLGPELHSSLLGFRVALIPASDRSRSIPRSEDPAGRYARLPGNSSW